MTGVVDELRRALLDVSIRATSDAPQRAIKVWVDTAFDGVLVFPHDLIAELGLVLEAGAEATLADGSKVVLKSYLCEVDWFGEFVSAQVIGNHGKLPLLGTELLDKRKLVVDYAYRILSIE